MSSQLVKRAQQHIKDSGNTAEDVKAMSEVLPSIIDDPSFFTLTQDVIFKTIEAYKGDLTLDQINTIGDALKKNHGENAVNKFKVLETVVTSLANIEDAKASNEIPVAEEEENAEDGGEEDWGNGEEEDNQEDLGISPEDVPEGLLRSIWVGDMKAVQQEIQKKSKMDEFFDRVGYPLHCAVFQDKTDIVEFLLKKGAKVNQVGALGQTPLHFACQGDMMKIFQLLVAARGIDLNAKDQEGDTPLIVATKNGKVDFIKALIKKKANINAVNNKNETALHVAALTMQTEAAKVLIAAGANISLMDMSFKTPFMVACASGATAIAALLQEKFSTLNKVIIEDYSDDE